jgi:enoyl-CoA hydratase/carnithine racemase
LRERARQAAADEAAGAVLVRGAGGVFSSGIDISVFSGWSEATAGDDAESLGAALLDRLQGAFNAIEDIDKPVVAAIEGYCFGGGLQLAIACHVRAVAPSAELSVLEAKWGIIPDLGATHRLARLIGLGRATELALTTRRVDADEALRIGLAEVRLDGHDPQDRALAFTAQLAALRRMPRLFRENWYRARDAALAEDGHVQLEVMSGPDFQEAVVARFEGREPRYTGR